jgi:hypothetical protein
MRRQQSLPSWAATTSVRESSSADTLAYPAGLTLHRPGGPWRSPCCSRWPSVRLLTADGLFRLKRRARSPADVE